MFNSSITTGKLVILCGPHEMKGEAFCTEDNCEKRILCYKCISLGHQHSVEKLANIVKLLKLPNSKK